MLKCLGALQASSSQMASSIVASHMRQAVDSGTLSVKNGAQPQQPISKPLVFSSGLKIVSNSCFSACCFCNKVIVFVMCMVLSANVFICASGWYCIIA